MSYQKSPGLSYFVHLLGCMLFICALAVQAADETEASAKRGAITGGVMHEAPSWFKDSFLDIQEDVDEAADEGRHVMLFFQLNACPYCDRMLTESFEAEPLKSFIQENYDVIAINVKGDREIAFNEDTSMIEKDLAEKLEVRATPAILFLNQENNAVVRVNGYRSPKRFQHILSYVSSKSYENSTLAEYMEKNLEKDVYKLRDNKMFSDINDLSSVKGPLAVIFEDSSCYDCDEFHDKLLAREDVQKEMEPFTVVRLDTDSADEITDPDGNKTTAADWAKKVEMTYRPGVLIFDEGKLMRRMDSLLFSHHFKESFRYIGGGFYKTQDYSEYSEQRTEELLSSGVDINLGE
ncbi:MAG: thioredoxin fold domain-containing protein [Thiolinea sp.]